MLLSDPLHSPHQLQPCELHVPADWQRGRERYLLWSIPVQCPGVLARLHAARQLLGNWLHPAGPRQAHISLFVCGFACTHPRYDDDIAPAHLAAQRRALEALRLAPFELRIGALDSFASAAFLAVAEQAPLDRLRQALAGCATEVRQAPYVPHLTVGLYRQAVSAQAWRARAESLSDYPPLTLPVRELQLVSYAAGEPQGALQVEARIALQGC